MLRCAGEMFKLPDELGESALDTYGWAPVITAVALAPCAALLLSYDAQLGLLMRPAAAQLLKVLQVVVPLAMLVWAAATARACWRCVSAAMAAGRASAAQALADAEQAVAAAEAAEREAAQALRQAEQAAQHAGQAAAAVDAGTPQHEANGEGPPPRTLVTIPRLALNMIEHCVRCTALPNHSLFCCCCCGCCCC